MSQPITFADVLDSAEKLDAEAQAELVAILSHRLAERGRQRVVATVEQARREFAAGQCEATTPAELVREARKHFTWFRSLCLAPLVLLAGCVIRSENPLSDPDKAKPDEALIGKWCLSKDKTSISAIEKINAPGYPPGVMKLTTTSLKGSEGPGITYSLEGLVLVFCTELKGKTYLNITSFNDNMENPAQLPAWKQVRSNGFYIFKYAVEKDKVMLWRADDTPLEMAVKNGKLKGTVRERTGKGFEQGFEIRPLVTVTDSGANLAELVAREDARIFSGQPWMVYTRAK